MFPEVKIINGPKGRAIGRYGCYVLIQVSTGLNAYRVIVRERQLLGTPDLSEVPEYLSLDHLLSYLV